MSDKFFNILRIVLLVIGVAVGLVYFLAIRGVEKEQVAFLIQTDIIAYLTYAFLAISAVIAIIAPIVIIAKNPKNAIGVLVGIVILVGLFFLAYVLASGAIDTDVMQRKEIAESTSKLVGTGIILTYILAGLALVTMAVSGLTRMFK